MSDKPSVLFVCVHNAGRSQMAAGWLRHLAGDRIEIRSAGTAPADQINPVAVAVMYEVGIDITDQVPKVLDHAAAQGSDVIITMGCGDACPYFPGKRYEDWKLDDPAGQPIDTVRRIRDDIRDQIQILLGQLLPDSDTELPAPPEPIAPRRTTTRQGVSDRSGGQQVTTRVDPHVVQAQHAPAPAAQPRPA